MGEIIDFNVIKGHASCEPKVQDAQKFVDLVTNGTPLEIAAKEVETPLNVLRRSSIVRQLFENLVPYYVDDKDERRKLIIAAMMKEMVTAEESGDRTAAARVLVKDPDVGFTAQPNAVVQVNISPETRALPADKLWPDEENENS